ncbi:MAG: hypothetical protein JWL88_718 [Parcubacteria group bacterium]|nr:hypothetical protein [Parcubacteria group bacterium]
MERIPNQKTAKVETELTPDELSPANDNIDQASELEELPDEETLETQETEEELDEKEKIRLVKERLLDAGHMTIGPLGPDAFPLSKDHVSTGEGVTIYHVDGRVEKRTLREDKAIRARELEAVRHFSSRSAQETQDSKTPLVAKLRKLTGRAKNWLKNTFKKLWLFWK